jgi:hypothetical protein
MRDCIKDFWFVFDLTFVILMVIETWVMPLLAVFSGGSTDSVREGSILRIARMVRLTRMARLFRFLRAVPELTKILKGMFVAFVRILFLMLVIVYAFAILMTTLTRQHASLQDEYFGSVPQSIGTLFLNGVMADQMPIVTAAGSEHWTYAVIMLVFVLLTTLTGVNMLVGTLVEVVRAVGELERERMDLMNVKAVLHHMWEEGKADENNDGKISRQEFCALIHKPEALVAMKQIGVDIITLPDVLDCIFEDDTPLSFSEFMDTLLDLRSHKTVTVKDILNLRSLILHGFMAEASLLTPKSRHHSSRKAADV